MENMTCRPMTTPSIVGACCPAISTMVGMRFLPKNSPENMPVRRRVSQARSAEGMRQVKAQGMNTKRE